MPLPLLDRGRACGRSGKNWTVSTGVTGGELSIRAIGDLNVITTCGLRDRLDWVCSAVSRIGDDGGKLGSGFEVGYAGGGCDGDGGDSGGERYGMGGANMIVVLESEKAESAVRLVQDIEGRLQDSEELCDCDEGGTSVGAES